MTSQVAPLAWNVPIVDPETGFPTPEFATNIQQWLKENVETAALADGAVQASRQIISGGGLTGGGDLSADRTLAVGAGTGITVNADDVAIDTTAEAERIRDVIGAALVAGTNITITVNDAGDTITIASTGGGGGVGYEAGSPTVPAVADFTWDYQGTSTATDGADGLIIKPQVDGVIHGLTKAAPAPPFDIYCRVEVDMFSTAAVTTMPIAIGGVLLKDGSDNERLVLGLYMQRQGTDEQNLYAAVGQRYTGASPPAFSATPILKWNLRAWTWLRVNVSSTTVTMYVGRDGKNWYQVGTEAISTFIDVVDRYGPFAFANADATEAVALFSYFSTSAPS